METTWLGAGEWLEAARALKQEGWGLLSLCGVDRLWLMRDGEARFEVVAHLLHSENKQRQRVHVAAEGDPPSIPSVVETWPTADFMEREAFDMFGIRFEGHPNLKRILMPDEWEGYPLRKDYAVGKVPVQFVPQPFAQIDLPGQAPSVPEAGGPADELGQAGRRG